MNLGNNAYPIRSKTLLRISNRILEDTFSNISAGGCLINNDNINIYIFREFNQIKNLKLSISEGEIVLWDKKFKITNLSSNTKMFITSLGNELQNKSFYDFYNSKKKNAKKLPFVVKKTLPVIKTLEGLIFIPHLNVYSNIKVKYLVNIEIVDYYKKYN